ncbi:replication protein P [Marinomonas atlantica]|uniref:replication protein P n=1 Tax=Marinomonas atlantica TaxID=1806668 RepID=UPI001E3325FF|nr:replication protein P [Marinomonas atlantica]
MKEPQPIQQILSPIESKLAAPSQTFTTQTGSTGQEQSQASQEAEQRTRVLVNMLFARFKAIYTHKFASAYSTTEEVKLAKREWAIALKGFQEPLLAYAVERTKERFAWPPTISEFLSVIQTAYKAYGLPEPRQAYMEACGCRHNPQENRWSHAAVYFAGSETGWHYLSTEDERTTRPIFEKHYTRLVDKVINGEKLVIPKPVMIEDKSAPILDDLLSDLSKQLNLTESDVAPYLYYLYKTKGTKIRGLYRERAQESLKALGYKGTLPH